MESKSKATVGISIGDPAGIGPEVIARAWVEGAAHQTARPVLIGSKEVMERAVEATSVKAKVRLANGPQDLSDSPEVLDVIDSGALTDTAIPLGEDTLTGGTASARWLEEADTLARGGLLDATIMGPISTGSLKMAGHLDKVISPQPGESYLILVSGPLRVAHLTDHMPISSVAECLTEDLIASALSQLGSAMSDWGVPKARIAVAGLNPHAQGEEEQRFISPGVLRAQREGVDARGPVSPDTVFRQCVEGQHDLVLAMYHDQGHIAIKTWGFSGNSVVILGPPYLHLSVAHGTAYDIVGTGQADHSMMANTLVMAGSLASGQGFT